VTVKRKRKRIRDHPSPWDNARRTYCVHLAPFGWIANVACGWPKSAHVAK